MNIKSKLLLIVFSILLLPPISIVLQIKYQQFTGNGFPEPLIRSILLLSGQVRKAVDSGDFSHLANLPEGTEVIVQTDSGEVLYKTANANLISMGVSAGRDYHAFRFVAEKTRGTVYLSLPGNLINATLTDYNSFGLPFVMVILLVVSLPLLILHSLSRSIRKLEKVTVKIASGDFDFPASDLATPDLVSLGKALDLMRRQLKEDRERRDRFIMGVSHDLKTPLAVIQGYLDALREGLADTDEKKTAYYEIMSSRADLLGARIGHLIDLAKTTTGEWNRTLIESDLGEFITDTMPPLADFCATRGFSLETRIDLPFPCFLAFDRDMILRVFENLVSNAVSYGDHSVPITVTARNEADTGSIEIRVENGGERIRAENSQKIFEPFFRGDKGRNDGGFGLGLASVKSIVETHGWTIKVETTPGSKTTFIIEVPALLVKKNDKREHVFS